jgi:flagellar biosynthetic protein FliO
VSKNKKRLLIGLFILLLVSTALLMATFGKATADRIVNAENKTIPGTSAGQTAGEISDEPVKTSAGGLTDGSITLSLLKLVAALIVVVIGIYGFLYVLRKMMGSKFSGNKKSRMIDVMETAYIAQKRSVSLVRFHDRAVLVGVSDNNIQPLAELTADETAKVLAEYAEEKPAPGFKNILGDAKEKIKAWNISGLGARDNASETKEAQTA